MGRDVKIRDSYQQDAIYLVRLSKAVEADPKRSAEWKRQVIGHLTAASTMMLNDEIKGVKDATRKESK